MALNSIMFLLIQKRRHGQNGRRQPLNSIMFLLIPSQLEASLSWQISLNSIMFLLIPRQDTVQGRHSNTR